MAKKSAAKGLLAHPRIRALAAELAIKAGAFAVLRGAERLLPGRPAKPKPGRKARALKTAAPVAAVAGAGFFAKLLFDRSKARRNRNRV